MDWQILNVLARAPRKKYIKKIVQYAALLRHCQLAVPQQTITPIGQQFPQDLQLSPQDSHKLVNALINLINWSQTVDFDPEKLTQRMIPHLQNQLTAILTEVLYKLQEDITTSSNLLVSQADKLINFDWQLDMQVASDKGKMNVPVVELQLITSKQSKVEHTRINMKGTQFDVFYKNLQKIKEQLSQLVNSKEQ